MKYNEIKKIINRPYFTGQSLHFYRLDLSRVQLSRWKKMGYIEPLKRGLYLFSEEKDRLSPQDVSFLLYQPSYISLEFALSLYGIIPELVHSITAVTTKTTRTFKNMYGTFIYRRMKPALFFGYTVIQTPVGKYCVAEPAKALLDYIYLNLDHMNDQTDINEMRINYGELKKNISKQKFHRYCNEFNIKKMNRLTDLILKQC